MMDDMMPFKFKKLPPWGPRLLKQLFLSNGEVLLPLQGGPEASLRVFHSEFESLPKWLFDFKWDDERCWLGIDDSGLLERHPMLAGMNLREVTRDVASAIMEAVLEKLMDGLEQISRTPCSIEGVSEGSAPYDVVDTVEIGFAFEIPDDLSIKGILWLGPAALAGLTSAFKTDLREGYANDLAFLPMPVTWDIGMARLKADEFNNLERDDIILMETGGMDEAVIYVADRPMFRAILKEDAGIVIKGAARIEMEENHTGMEERVGESGEETEFMEPKILDSDDLPVDVRFQVGRQSVTLAELKAIKPGYLFETDIHVEKPVTIIANGVKVGMGEILDVSGRVGVRVVEFFKDAKP